ncbi:MAG: leucine-rich repeat domain-containing protein [Ureaplasma sp.]|nr:leucine-rich repeat domain-containing protein [Ureaplasma sp.]MDE6289750.1 leucine-rich repeat domain-containing protein [Ureaplasma sp.]
MFSNCKLEKVIIPSNVVSIGDEAFSRNFSLLEIVISENPELISVSTSAFTVFGDVKIYVPNENIKQIFLDAKYSESSIVIRTN